MKRANGTIVSIALAYVGAVVGAGFISGQELVQFFVRFGIYGLAGWICIASIVIIGGGNALGYLSRRKYQDVGKFLKETFPNNEALIANVITVGYLFGGLIIMTSGASNILAEVLGTKLQTGILFVIALIFIVIVGRGQRLLQIKNVLIPFLLITSTITAAIESNLFNLGAFNQSINIPNPSPLIPNWWLAVPIYLGYNIVGALVSFINISRETDEKHGKYGGYLGGILISLLGSLLMITMYLTYPTWSSSEMPLISIIKKDLFWMYIPFSITMLIAMFTVAANYALGMAYYIEGLIKTRFDIISLFVLAPVGLLSLLGFSRLLGIIYPFFGISTMVLIAYTSVKKVIYKLQRKVEVQNVQ